MFGNRDVFAYDEPMAVEAEDRFVSVLSGLVGECPPAALLVNQPPMFVRVAVPEAPHRAGGSRLFPTGLIEMALSIERRNELIAMSWAAVGELRCTGKFETDLFQAHCVPHIVHRIGQA